MIQERDETNAVAFLKQLEIASNITGNPCDFVSEKCDICNNIALALRGIGKLKSARAYLDKCLKLASDNPDIRADISTTHMNLQYILSSKGKHRLALKHGMLAI